MVRFASVGDVIRSTSVLDVLRTRFPGAVIDYLTSEMALDILKENTCLRRVYTDKDLSSLPDYDWIINLQQPDPPPGFLGERDFQDVLVHLRDNVTSSFRTGRRLEGAKETRDTNAFYCQTETEEQFRIALLSYASSKPPPTRIALNPQKMQAVRERFGLSGERRAVGLFIGGPSSGGHDGGSRTYSIDYLCRVVAQLWCRKRCFPNRAIG